MAHIGLYTCVLEMPWVETLKEKRSIVKSITEKLKSRFPVSVARLSGQNTHHWEQIGVVMIHADPKWIEQHLQWIVEWIHREGPCLLRDEQLAVVALAEFLDLPD